MFARQYGSLTGSVAFQYYPDQTIVVTQASLSPVTLGEAKNFLRIYDTIDDTSIQSLLNGVTVQVEHYIGRDTTPRTRTSHWSRPKMLIAIPRSPIGWVSYVVEVASDGTQTTVDPSEYVVEGLDQKSIRFNTVRNALLVTYSSGYAVCPDVIKGAILQELSLQYKNRQDSSQPSRTSVNGLSIEARHLLVGGGFYDYNR